MITGITDIHSHVVYRIDDGAKNLEMSLEMLRSAEKQGVRNVFCTAHSMSNWKYYEERKGEIQERFRQEGGTIRLYSGCEILCGEWNLREVICGLQNGTFRTLNETEWALLEFDPRASGEEILHCVRGVLAQTDKRVVIAHVERCLKLPDDVECVEELRQLGCLLQVNAYSLEKESNPVIREFARELITKQWVTFLGSDAHRTDHRPPEIADGVRYLCRNCDAEYAEAVCKKNAERYLGVSEV